jgi:hypothetical protein
MLEWVSSLFPVSIRRVIQINVLNIFPCNNDQNFTLDFSPLMLTDNPPLLRSNEAVGIITEKKILDQATLSLGIWLRTQRITE